MKGKEVKIFYYYYRGRVSSNTAFVDYFLSTKNSRIWYSRKYRISFM
jgi:hypothetical protein